MTKPSSGRSSLRHDALLQVLSFWPSSLPQCCNSRSRSLLQQYQCNREQSAQFTQQTNKHVRVFPFPKTLLFHPGSTISLKSPRWHTIYSVHFRAIKGSEPNKLNDEETAKECVDTVISGQEDEDDEEEEEDGDEEEDIEEEKTMEESGASYVERKDEVITVQWLVRPRIMVMITWILLDYTVQRCHWQCFDQPPILVLSLIIFHWLLMNKDSANDRCSSLICYRLVEREDIFAGDWLCWRSSTPKTFSSQIKGCRSWQWFLLGVTSKGAGLGFFESHGLQFGGRLNFFVPGECLICKSYWQFFIIRTFCTELSSTVDDWLLMEHLNPISKLWCQVFSVLLVLTEVQLWSAMLSSGCT